jgi:hypothetical protein
VATIITLSRDVVACVTRYRKLGAFPYSLDASRHVLVDLLVDIADLKKNWPLHLLQVMVNERNGIISAI